MMAHWFESWRERGSNRGTRSDKRARRKRQAYQLKVRNPKRGPLLVPVLRAGGFSRPLYTSRDWEPRVILRIRYPLPRRVLTAVAAAELFHPPKGDHIEVPDGILLLLRMHSGREACLLGNIVVTVIPMTRSLASKVGWFKFVRETFTGNNKGFLKFSSSFASICKSFIKYVIEGRSCCAIIKFVKEVVKMGTVVYIVLS